MNLQKKMLMALSILGILRKFVFEILKHEWHQKINHFCGKTGSSGWKIKWLTPFCLRNFRKYMYRLWLEANAIFLLFLVCSPDFHILCSRLLFHHVMSLLLMCKIPTWVVWVNGIKHPRTFQALVYTILIVHVLFSLWHF